MPSTTQVCTTPVDVADAKCFIKKSDSGDAISAPPPKPMIAIPVDIPRRSGNHAINVDTGVMYPIPRPQPPITP